MDEQGIMGENALTIRVHTPGGSTSYGSVEEIPEGLTRGIVTWMLYTGTRAFSSEQTVIEIRQL